MKGRVALVALFVLIAGRALFAQSAAARIDGMVQDASGAVVAGARVTATNQETREQRSNLTNDHGLYVLYPLSPGVYTMTAEIAGFRAASVENLRLDVTDTLVRNFTLEVGSVQQDVTVSAEAVPIINQTMSVESLVTRDQLEVLPLNGRDFSQLALLAAGAVDSNVQSGKDAGPFAVNGNRSYSNEFLVDGVSNDNRFNANAAVPLSVDAIAQFKLISGVAPAEYGQAATTVTMVTRSGSNAFHGSLFEFYRGNTWLAKSPFDTGSAVQPYTRNQYGGTFGGPVLLPRFNGRNRTFFFFNYEGSLQEDNAVQVSTVPLPAFWKGDFSAILARGIQLRDPLVTGRPNISGNRLDQYLGGARISPIAVALHPYFPDPTSPGYANNLTMFPSEYNNRSQFTTRIDQALPRSESLSFRISYTNGESYNPNLIGNPGTGMIVPTYGRNGNLTWSAPLGARVVNQLIFGAQNFSSLPLYKIAPGMPTDETIGWNAFAPPNPAFPPIAQILFNGTDALTGLSYTSGGNNTARIYTENIFQLTDTVSFSRGRHYLKAGFQGIRHYVNALHQSPAGSSIVMNGGTGAVSSGYTFADFMMGLQRTTRFVPPVGKAHLIQAEVAGFIQDDWKVLSRLTVTAGVRYELRPWPYEKDNRWSIFTPSVPGGGMVVACSGGQLPARQFQPQLIAALADKDGKLPFPVVCGSDVGYDPRRLLVTGKNNWGPRVGLTWDPSGTGRYSIRAGYGTFFSSLPLNYMLQTVMVNVPFAGLLAYQQAITNGVPNVTFSQPLAAKGSTTINAQGMDQDFMLPNNQQWNLGMERVFGGKTVFSLGYVGNKGTHLFRGFNQNQPYYDPILKTTVNPFAGNFTTSTIKFIQTSGDSTYHSMVLEARRRVAHGLMFQANWTWAKGIDNTDGNPKATALDVHDPGRDRANSDYVRRHSIHVNSSYELPVGRNKTLGRNLPSWANAVAGGWSVNAIYHYTTGRYMTPQYNSDSSVIISADRPDAVGISPNLPRDQRTPARWFNTAAFASPPVLDPATGLPRLGNSGRNVIVGPGLNIMDAGIYKRFRMGGEKRMLTFRVELFNALNHPNWANPDINVSNVNTAATISDISKPMRQTQFAVRFDF